MRLSLLFLCLFLFTTLSAQTLFTRLDVDSASDIAAAKGTFVILDFYADWCGPCKVMDEKVWSLDTVQALQNRFVNVRIDATNPNTTLDKYGVKALPTLIVLDANGKEYYRRKGYMTKEDVLTLFHQFPPNMQAAYAADYLVKEQPDAFNTYFMLARNYQEAARQASGAIASQLAGASNKGLEQAQKILSKKSTTPESLMERLSLMEAENLLLKGRAKKALKLMASLNEELNPKNEELACYIKAQAYRKTNQPELAGECYDLLQEAADNEVFVAMYKKKQ